MALRKISLKCHPIFQGTISVEEKQTPLMTAAPNNKIKVALPTHNQQRTTTIALALAAVGIATPMEVQQMEDIKLTIQLQVGHQAQLATHLTHTKSQATCMLI